MSATVDMGIDIDQGIAGCSWLQGKEPFDLSDFSEFFPVPQNVQTHL